MNTPTHRAPAILVSLALLLATANILPAQITPQNDPANLAGERVSPPDLADDLPINHGAPALQQLLRKLRTRASFMLIVAHPDDEDNGLLTYLSRGQGARVATLTLNRGEGGQNLMSADFDDALGLIRTQELLAADRYMGVDQFFGTEVDFGFSKTKEESFAKWGHDRVLYDAVRAIRLYRPLVIASVFIGAPSDGHGQHQVSGQIAQEAFKAAGDPTVFPDQIASGLQPWQPLKVYARSPFARIDAQGMYDYAIGAYVPPRFTNYVTGKITTTVPKANVVIPEGNTDPLLGGESYAQFGREGRNLQRSQIGGGGGPGRGGPGGRADVSYHRYGSKLNQPDGDDSGLEPSLFEGIDTTLPGIATLAPEVSDMLTPGLQRLDGLIAKAQHDFDPANLAAIAPTLRKALSGLDELIAELEKPGVNDLPPTESVNLLHELRIKRVQLNNALVLAHGLTLEAHLGPGLRSSLIAGWPTADVTATTAHPPTDPARSPLKPVQSGISATGEATNSLLNRMESGAVMEQKFRVFLKNTEATRPYFSRRNIEQSFYDVSEPSLRNAPATPAPLTAWAIFDDQGVPLRIEATVRASAASRDLQPAVFVPPISVSVSPPVGVIPQSKSSLAVTAQIRGQAIASDGSVPVINSEHGAVVVPAEGKVHLDVPLGWRVEPASASWKLNVDESTTLPFTITPPPAVAQTSHTYEASAASTSSNSISTYSEGFRPIGYPGLTYTNYYTPATLRVVPVDVTTAPNLKIAYLSGTGDAVPAALEDLGVNPTMLTVADINPATLSKYDAVILGVRAYTAHAELAGAGSQPLLQYASAGGVVIVQYNNGRYGDPEAPYPITTPGSSGDHAHDVIDESAPVTILAPDSPLLTWPNKITTADFSGWVAERGHSFAGTWSPEYTPLLESHDPNQEPQRGGLLAARVGQGTYIYLGYALYRQFPEGVPGAYRLLANLISAAKNPALQK